MRTLEPPPIAAIAGVNQTATASEKAVHELFSRYVLGNYKRSHVLTRGKGTEVWDINGKRYLDLGGGVAVNSLGHAHPAIQNALLEQSSQLIHSSNLYYHLPQGLLAEQIVKRIAPGRVFFCNSGAEANEALFKLARRFGHDTSRFEIITTTDSFHGRTLAAIAATGQEKVKTGFGPAVQGFQHVPFNDLPAVSQALSEKTVAILVEGIQGESGIEPATPEYLMGLRQLCDERGLLLMMDAVQCGMFRTGRFQSYQRILEDTSGGDSFFPDAISMAKSLGGGFPIGAAWIAEKHAGLLGPGSHGTTYGGTPLACAVSLAIFDTIEKQGLMQNARRQGERLKARLETIAASHPEFVKEVRGMGCMLGVQTIVEPAVLVSRCADQGLLVIPSGRDTVRFLPPLNISDAEVEEAAHLFDHTIKSLA